MRPIARLVILPLAISIAGMLQAAEISKVNTTIDPLNTGPAWLGGIVPGPNDIAVWDSTITSLPNNNPLGGDLSWLGIKVTNVGGTPNATGQSITVSNPGSANILTIGTAGIDLSTAAQAFQIQSQVMLAGNQTWSVPNINTNTGSTTGVGVGEDLAFLGQIQGTALTLDGFTLNKSGAGTLAFSHGFTVAGGTINLSGGLMFVQGAGNRTTTLADSVTINVKSGATLRLHIASGSGGVSTQVNAPITLEAGSTLALTDANNNFALNIAGTVAVAGDTAMNVSGASSGAINFSGNLEGAANVTYANTATSGFVRMSGNNANYSGILTMLGATGARLLRLTSATAGSSSATWVVNAGNILQVDGVAVNLGTLNGAGTVTNSHAIDAATLSIGAGIFSGIISDGLAPMAVTKIGTGMLTLSGASSYSGATFVNSGALIASTAQTGATSVNVANGATFGVSVSAAGTTFNVGSLTAGTTAGTTLQLDAGTFGNPTAPIVAATNFTPVAPTTLKLLGANLSAGTFPLLDYTGSIAGGGFSALTLTLPFRVAGSLVNNAGNTSIDVNIDGTDTPKWRGNVNGVWDIDPNNTGATGTPNWRTSSTNVATRYVQGPIGVDSVIFDDSSTGTTTVSLATALAPLGVTVNNTALPYTFIGPGKITGSTGLLKQGSNTLILGNTGGNDYQGATNIDAGTLQIGDGTVNGSIPAGSITIAPGARLVFNRADLVTLPNLISGAGDVTHLGSGTTVFTESNTFTGALTVSVGTVQIGNNTASGRLGTGNVSIATGAKLDLFNSTGLIPLPGSISGTGTIQKRGLSEVALEGFNTFSGTLQIDEGTLALRGSGSDDGVPAVVVNGTGRFSLGSGFVGQTATISSLSGSGGVDPQFDAGSGPRTLNVNQVTNTIYSGVARDAPTGGRVLALTKSGSGTLTLAGANTYSDLTTVDGGTLLISGSLSGTSTVVVNTGGTLGGTGSVNSFATITVNAGGKLGLASDAATVPFSIGSVLFSDSSTFSLDIGATAMDQLAITGQAQLSGAVNLGVTLLADPVDGTTFTILDTSTPLFGYAEGGRFQYLGNSLDENEIFTVNSGAFAQKFQITYLSENGNDVALLAVPEPAVITSLCGGIALFAMSRRRRVRP